MRSLHRKNGLPHSLRVVCVKLLPVNGYLIPRRFPGVYRLFAGLAPVIAAEFAVLLDDPVAGDDKGYGISDHREADASDGHL